MPESEELKEVKLPIKFRSYQYPLYEAMNEKKRAIIVYHRRAGKDITCWNIMLIKALTQRKGAYYYIFPSFRQARKAIWEAIDNDGRRFLDYIPRELLTSKPNASEMRIELKSGSIIRLLGSDDFDSVRGTNPVGVVFSEFAYQKPEVWYQVVEPALRINGGWAIFNSTPYGKNHFYKMFNYAKQMPDEWFFQMATIDDTGIVNQKELDVLKDQGVSDESIAQEYNCFPGDAPVMCDTGLKRIDDIRVGDLVLSHSGRFRKVLKTYCREYSGDMVSIKTNGSYESIECTPDHPIRVYDRTSQTYSYKAAKDIDKTDLLTFPKMSSSSTQFIDEDIAILIAWYISQGSSFKCGASFSFSNKKHEYIAEVESICNRKGIKTLRLANIQCNTISVIAYDVKLVDFLKSWCGTCAKDKRIPLNLIYGHEKLVYDRLIKGDGCTFIPDNGAQFDAFTTVSKTLAYQMQLLSHSIGKKAGITFRGPQKRYIDGREIIGGPSYALQIRETNKEINKRARGLFSGKSCIAALVLDVQKTQYSANVYNLRVQYDETYTVSGRVVHNCSFDRGVEGSYYGRILRKIRDQSQICKVFHDEFAKTYTAWDIGIGDSTAIWFFQVIKLEVHFIDYYETSGESIAHYARVIDEKGLKYGYRYEQHFAPHDIKQRELGTGFTRLSIANDAGIDFTVLPIKPVDTGIEIVRKTLARTFFDEEKCKKGIEALEAYQKRWDERNRIYSSHPLHNWCSHAADAMRYACSAIEDYVINSQTTLTPESLKELKQKARCRFKDPDF
jgi:hypothetical protein